MAVRFLQCKDARWLTSTLLSQTFIKQLQTGVPFNFGNLSATQSILLVQEAEFFFGKLIVAQLVEKVPHFIKAEC
jgi:predicted transporter